MAATLFHVGTQREHPPGGSAHSRAGRIAGRGWRAAPADRAWAPGANYWRRPGGREIMILLFDIGNTNTHLGIGNRRRVTRQRNIPTAAWFDGSAERLVKKFANGVALGGAALCSVVPRANPAVRR